MLKRIAYWLSAAGISLVLTSAHAAVFEVSDGLVGSGTQFKSYAFTINSIGTYQATLGDYGFPEAFTSLKLGIAKTAGPMVGSISNPGSFFFEASTPGSYTALLFGKPSAEGGSYSITVAAVPEPEVWAMMLIGAGLIGYQARRKAKAGPTKIVA